MVLVLAVGYLLVMKVLRDEGIAPGYLDEESAWENRQELDRVLAETAELAGVDGKLDPVSENSLTCERNDGRDGVSYFLHTIATDRGMHVDTASPGCGGDLLEGPRVRGGHVPPRRGDRDNP